MTTITRERTMNNLMIDLETMGKKPNAPIVSLAGVFFDPPEKMRRTEEKKNGEMAKNLNRLETNVKMSFCPFCGESQG